MVRLETRPGTPRVSGRTQRAPPPSGTRQALTEQIQHLAHTRSCCPTRRFSTTATVRASTWKPRSPLGVSSGARRCQGPPLRSGPGGRPAAALDTGSAPQVGAVRRARRRPGLRCRLRADLKCRSTGAVAPHLAADLNHPVRSSTVTGVGAGTGSRPLTEGRGASLDALTAVMENLLLN